MTVFWTLCVVLLMVALLFIVLPLWRNTGNDNDVLRDKANLEILRDQMAELETDLKNGLLTPDAFEQGKRELQLRLLEEVQSTGSQARLPHNPARALAVVLALLLPLFCVPLYLKIGNTDAIVPKTGAAVSPETVLQGLEKKVVKQPEDPNNLVLLARSYNELKRYQDAVGAYAKLVELVPEEAEVWAEYAEVSGMANQQSLKGEPTRFINKALELDGSNPLALELAGYAAAERGDYGSAIAHWTKLVNSFPPNSPELQGIRDNILQARKMLAAQGKKKRPSVGAEAVATPGIKAN